MLSTILGDLTSPHSALPAYSSFVNPPYHIYVGEDKVENEELIRWGFDEDVWFHVDKLSSAHVYLRLKEDEAIDDIPEAVIQDCVQLVKANSIQGNKANNLDVVYTMWGNLKKTADMAVGQIGFHKQKEVMKVRVEKRLNEIVNRLNKTKVEKKPDFRAEREERDRKIRENQKAIQKEQRKLEKEEAERKQKEAEARSYSNLMTSDKMCSNADDGNDSDDFM